MSQGAGNFYSVSQIKAKLLRPALTSHYECKFPIPSDLNNPGAGMEKYFLDNNYIDWVNDQEYLTMSCSEATLPGFSLLSHEINNDYTGVTERHAYRRAFDDRIDFTFYVDSDYTPINFFTFWLKFIADERDEQSGNSKSYNYRFRFPGQYQSDISVKKFERDPNSKSYLLYRFFQAFPISMNSIPVSYDASQLLKCTVSFAYTRYSLISQRDFGTSTLKTQPNPNVQQIPVEPFQSTTGSELRRPLGQQIGATQRGTILGPGQ